MAILWSEINAGMPQFSIVGRNDGPAESRGQAAAAVVQFLSNTATTLAVNRHINQSLERISPLASELLETQPSGGVLAVALIEAAQFGELQGQRFIDCFISGGAFQTPESALHHYQRQPRLEPGLRSRIGNMTRRYFWGRLTR